MYPKQSNAPGPGWEAKIPGIIHLYEGVEVNMSVLLKRSRWVLPAAGLLLGALSLGLTGCGGDNTPPAVQSNPIPVVAPVDVTASNPTPAVMNQALAFVTSANPTTTTGVTAVKVNIPINSLGETTSLAAEVVQTSQGVVVRTQQQPGLNFPAGISQVAEIAFGSVAANNLIDVNQPISFAGPITITISLTPEQVNTIQSSLNSGDVLHVRVLGVVGNQNQLIPLPNPNAVLSGNTISFTATATGEYVITLDPTHQQGEIG